MSELPLQRWIYQSHPTGVIGPEHYRLENSAISTALSINEVLLETHYLSVDPYMRIIQSQKPTFDEHPHALGVVQAAAGIARVLRSNSPMFEPGDWVEGPIGWQTHAKMHASSVRKLDPNLPVTTALGVLGMPGRTAWFGFLDSAWDGPPVTIVEPVRLTP